MEEIRFFGDTLLKGGRLAKNIATLMSNQKIKDQNLYCPYTYLYDIESTTEFDSSSFEWPVNFKASLSNNELHFPTVAVNSCEELKKEISKIKAIDAEAIVLISVAPSTIYGCDTYYSSCFYYLAKNYLMISNPIKGYSYVINTNNNTIFKKVGLDRELVYRLIQTRDEDGSISFAIESIFEYNDPRLNEIRGRKIKDIVSDKEFGAEFVDGYRQGFNSDMMPYRVFGRSVNTSYLTCARESGNMIGRAVRSNITETIRGMNVKVNSINNLTYVSSLIGILNQEQYKLLKENVGLHNSIINDLNKETLILLQSLFDRGVKANTLSGLLMMANGISWNIFNYSRGGHNVSDLPVVQIVGLDQEPNKVNLKRVIRLPSGAQIRATGFDKVGGVINIRFQASNMGIDLIESNEDSKESILGSYSDNGLTEVDITVNKKSLADDLGENCVTVKELIKRFDKAKHTSKSKHGTEQMYVPIKIVGNDFVNSNTGDIMFPREIILSHFRKAGFINTKFVEPSDEDSEPEDLIKESKYPSNELMS
jgi:hypothetical protein